MAQWLVYVTIVLSHISHITFVTGSKVNGALKVIRPFHTWILFFSTFLSILLYKIRGKEKSYIFIISMLTSFFSSLDFCLHFVDDFYLLMSYTRVITDGLYFTFNILCTFKLILHTVRSSRFLKKSGNFKNGIKSH